MTETLHFPIPSTERFHLRIDGLLTVSVAIIIALSIVFLSGQSILIMHTLLLFYTHLTTIHPYSCSYLIIYTTTKYVSTPLYWTLV